MSRVSVLILPLLLLATLLVLACGKSMFSGIGRQLQSITIQATAIGNSVQFVATGTYSAPPTTVSPLPVDWANGFLAPPVETMNYTLTAQPYAYNCTASSGAEIQVTALAPQNPGAPSSGSMAWSHLVFGHSAATCP